MHSTSLINICFAVICWQIIQLPLNHTLAVISAAQLLSMYALRHVTISPCGELLMKSLNVPKLYLGEEHAHFLIISNVYLHLTIGDVKDIDDLIKP